MQQQYVRSAGVPVGAVPQAAGVRQAVPTAAAQGVRYAQPAGVPGVAYAQPAGAARVAAPTAQSVYSSGGATYAAQPTASAIPGMANAIPAVAQPVMLGADVNNLIAQELGMLLGGGGLGGADMVCEVIGIGGPGGMMMAGPGGMPAALGPGGMMGGGDMVVVMDAGPMMMGDPMMGGGGMMMMGGDPMMGGGGMMIMDGGMGMGGVQVMGGGGGLMAGPGGGQIVAAPQFRAPQQISLEDLPFSSVGHKAMWTGIFDMVQREVDAFLKSQKTNPASQFKTPRIPMPNIPDKQIEMIFNSYDMQGTGTLDRDRLKALMRDMQCVTCVAMSNQKGEALQEARNELTQMMGPQIAMMMSGAMSQMMDFELQMVKHISMQEVPEEECTELIKELDADKDGIVSKRDFMMNAKKALFDPNPPEEIMQAMEAMEAAVNCGCPVAVPFDGGMMVIEAAPVCGPGGMPMLGGPGVPMAMPIMDGMGGGMAGPGGMFVQAGPVPTAVPVTSAAPAQPQPQRVVIGPDGIPRQSAAVPPVGAQRARGTPVAAAGYPHGVQQAISTGVRIGSAAEPVQYAQAGTPITAASRNFAQPATSVASGLGQRSAAPTRLAQPGVPSAQPGSTSFSSVGGTMQARVLGGGISSQPMQGGIPTRAADGPRVIQASSATPYSGATSGQFAPRQARVLN